MVLDYLGAIIVTDVFLDDQNKISINEDPLYNEKLKGPVLNRYKALLNKGIWVAIFILKTIDELIVSRD